METSISQTMIKKILFAAAVLLLVSTTATAQREIVRLTRYEGQAITGIAASHMFKVEIVGSPQTKAVVEIDADLEQYLRFELRASGAVSVGLAMPDDVRQHFNRGDNWRRHTLKMTVYTPGIKNIDLQDVTHLSGRGTFEGERVEIEVNDMAKIDELSLRAEEVSVKVDGMASANLALTAESLAAEADGMAKLNLSGEVRQMSAKADGMARITASELQVERAEARANGMARIAVNARDSFYGRASGVSSVRNTGSAAEIDLETPTRNIRRSH